MRKDRGVVKRRISAEGLRILQSLDEPLHELHHRQFGSLSEAQTQRMLDQLKEVHAAGRVDRVRAELRGLVQPIEIYT